MKIEHVKIGEIKPNPDNPRIIKNDKYAKLVKSIKEFPQMLEIRPIVVDADGMVLGGNMRLKACKEAGLKQVPIIRASELSEDQKREFIIKDNVAFGEWDWNVLANNWHEQQLDDWGLDVMVHEQEPEPEDIKEDDYEIPEQIETEIKNGDIITIGEHRLVCGDATKDLGKLMGTEMFDCVVTDPPYNVDYTGGTKDKLKIMNDKMGNNQFYEFLLAFYKHAASYTKKGGSFYVWHADSEGLNFRKAFIDAGIDLKQCLIWVKNALVMGRQDYQWKHEPCLYGWVPGASHYFTRHRDRTTVIDDKLDFTKMKKDELVKLLQEIHAPENPTSIIYHNKPVKNDVHPTMKPVTLMGNLIFNSSKPGEIIGDPFLGSGSTMVAAHQMQRKCYGLELDPKYCQVIVDRMLKFDGTLTTTLNGKQWRPTFLEK